MKPIFYIYKTINTDTADYGRLIRMTHHFRTVRFDFIYLRFSQLENKSITSNSSLLIPNSPFAVLHSGHDYYIVRRTP